MNDNNQSQNVQIMGKAYNIRCPDEQFESLNKAAMLLDKKMREIAESGQIRGIEKVAIMAALNISHDLLCLQNQKDEYIQVMGQRIQALHKKIENSLTPQKQLEL